GARGTPHRGRSGDTRRAAPAPLRDRIAVLVGDRGGVRGVHVAALLQAARGADPARPRLDDPVGLLPAARAAAGGAAAAPVATAYVPSRLRANSRGPTRSQLQE